jgi:hypothetical protein
VNVKNFSLEAKRKAYLRIVKPETISMVVIPKSKSGDFAQYPVVDETLKIGELDLRICSDDPEDKKKAAQNKDKTATDGPDKTSPGKTVPGKDSGTTSSDCGKSVNVSAGYKDIVNGEFKHASNEEYIVLGRNQYIGVKASYYDLGEFDSTRGSLAKGGPKEFAGVWVEYKGVERREGESIYQFRINVRPTQGMSPKKPVDIIRNTLHSGETPSYGQPKPKVDNFGPDTPHGSVPPMTSCGDRCFDISLLGLQSSLPFRVSDLWGELTLISEQSDGSVQLDLTTMSLETRKPKMKKAKQVSKQ